MLDGETQSERGGSPTSYLACWLFLRLLGLVYLFAFVSLWVQIDGLLGSNGILPVQPYLDRVAAFFGPGRFWEWPTLFWLGASDAALHAVCAAGALLAVLLLLGIAPLPVLVLLWGCYLSLLNVGQVFLGYQWDVLLVETGFLAIWLAPRSVRPQLFPRAHPAAAPLFLLHLLLIKVMLLSGLVKLGSGDPTWRDLTAMSYHYLSQPLPALPAYFAHHLPLWFHRLETLGTFLIELAVPPLIFAPRRLRQGACAALLTLQVLIAVTGNYGFFNLLTVALCVLLLDDGALGRFTPRVVRARLAEGELPARPRLAERRTLLSGAAIVMAIAVLNAGGFRTFNQYGLFAVMTTSRSEIIVEGSSDGRTWRAYEFRWKPGDLARAPRWVAPHQPRLDWQMWFAALGTYERNVWLQQFMTHLLRGTPEVVALLEHNPFPDAPPTYVRAELYDYRFTSLQDRGAGAGWWTRTYLGPYSPVLSRLGATGADVGWAQ